MKKRFKSFPKIGSLILLPIGFACTFIKWGDPSGFHGQGFPLRFSLLGQRQQIPGHPRHPRYRVHRFPEPFGLHLTPLIVLISGIILYFAIELGIKLTLRNRQVFLR
ncbi:MAG: hypothetical protein ACI9NQ_000984 [Paracoccaceae bacterium]|jgi:hypothetical protein